MKIIPRKQYLDQLIALKDKQLIKVITGVRRCGKSTLLLEYMNYLKQQGITNDQIIFINFEDLDYIEYRDLNKLYAYIRPYLNNGKKIYIFLDEIQHVKDFPIIVDGLYIKENVDIYITGSNAYMLSSEIATLISGRYVEIFMLPLSFKEYVEWTGNKTDLARKYTDYIFNSSFPYTLQLRDNEMVLKQYMNSIYVTLIRQDVANRNKFTNLMMLDDIVHFMFDNISNILSTKKIADTMSSGGRKIDAKTVEKYITGLIESYVLYRVKRYDLKGKQHLKTQEKYYLVDIGLRYAVLGSRSTDIGRMLENVVYLELLRRGYEVYIGKIDELEVDFVAVDRGRITYYQVSATVREENTLKRELAPLKKINDHYEKIILTLDEDPEADYDGIRIINVYNWLLK